MKKYIVIIDYKAGVTPAFKYAELQSTRLDKAMAEAETLFNDSIYLINIAEKKGKVEKVEGGKVTKYFLRVQYRGHGWEVNADRTYYCEKFEYKSGTYFSLKLV